MKVANLTGQQLIADNESYKTSERQSTNQFLVTDQVDDIESIIDCGPQDSNQCTINHLQSSQEKKKGYTLILEEDLYQVYMFLMITPIPEEKEKKYTPHRFLCFPLFWW